MCSTVLLIPGITSFITENMKIKSQMKSNQPQAATHAEFTQYFMDWMLDIDRFQNGSGLKTAYLFLKELTDCIANMERNQSFPVLNIMHVSSSTIYRKVNVTALASPSSSKTRIRPSESVSDTSSETSSDSPFTGTPKRWQGSSRSTPKRGRKRKAEDYQVMSPPSPLESSENLRDDYLKKNGYCDLIVTTVNTDNLAKYVLLVEVLSHCTSLNKCVWKMYKELICVLQTQKVVYGVIFSPQELVILYAQLINPDTTEIEDAHRGETSGDGIPSNVVVGQESYVMYDNHKQFDVKKYQLFTMDLLSIMLYGIMCD